MLVGIYIGAATIETVWRLFKKGGMRREAGRGIRMGNTCKPMADSCQCMAKTTTIL